MINTEKEILATVIVFPKAATIFFDNIHNGDFFMARGNQDLFKTLKVLWDEKNPWSPSILIDLLPSQVDFLMNVYDYVKTLTPDSAEQYMLERIRIIKTQKTKEKLLRQIQAEVESPLIDFDTIIEIAESGKIVNTTRERGDFHTAINEYTEWKNRVDSGLTLCFPAFDKKTGDYNYGEILSIMSRTAVGKTFIALNIINSIIGKTDNKIGLFSLEMAKSSVIERLMQLHFNMFWIELDEERKAGTLDIEEFIARYKERFRIYSKIYTAYEIQSIIARDNLKVVFIDYLQLIKKDKEGRSRYEKVTYLMEQIKEMAKNLDIFIVLLVQITRAGEGGWEPVEIDMARESGAIEENSDFIIGAWDPSLNDISEDWWQGKLCMKLLKNKRGPQQGCVFSFDKDSRKLYEIAQEIPRKEKNNGRPTWVKD